MVNQDYFKEIDHNSTLFFYIGKFCHQLLNNASRWRTGTTLVDVVKVIVKYLNEPDPDYAVDFSKEFIISIFYIVFFSMCRYGQGICREQRRIQIIH